MKARARTAVTTLALLLGAAGALLYAWCGVEQRGQQEGRKKEEEERILAFAPGEARTLRVEARGEATALTRTGKGWRIDGLDEEADAGAVEALLSRLAGLRRKAEVAARPDAAALATSGLSPPRGRLLLTLEDGRQLSLAVGQPSAFDGSVPVRAGEGPVLLVGAEAEGALLRGTEDLRDRALLRFEPGKVMGLRLLAGARVAWELERRPPKEGGAAGGGQRPDGVAWALTAPRAAPARADKVEALLRALAALRALRFAGGAEKAREAGLSPPARTLVLRGEGGAELGRVELGREAHDSLFARSSAAPRILEVDRGSLAALPASAGELVEEPAPPAKQAEGGAPPSGQ